MPNNLLSALGKDYKLLHFGDLADVCNRHGSIFQLFESLYKESFAPNERIVFYSSHRPSLKILNHLQRAASTIDISNWFIIICGPHDITQDLAQANQKYGYDAHSISWHQTKLAVSTLLDDNNIYPYEGLCPAPFNSISTQTNLNVSPCCKYEGITGNLKNNSIVEIMKSAASHRIRQQFKQGIKPHECNVCWKIESLGGTSFRQHLLDKDGFAADLTYIDTPEVKSFSTMLGTACNFKCRICSSNNSTAIAAEELRFTTDINKKQELLTHIQNTAVFDFEQYLTTLAPILPSLAMLHMLGGEPLLEKNFIPLLDFIIKTGHNTHIKIHINTNGSIWNDELISRLIQFEGVEILISLDDIGKRFEVQRGGNWESVDQNVQRWANLRSNIFVVKIVPTVNIQNVLYLDQLITYCQKLNLEIVWWYLEEPEVCCIDNMTSTAKQLVYTRYVNHANPELKQIAKRMTQTPATSGNLFLALMNEYDRRRGTNFADAHREIVDAMQIDKT